MQRIQDRVAVVTGASGGIGRAVALELAGRGAHLAIQDLRPEPLEETAEAARAMGRTVLSRVFDVSDGSEMGAFAQAVRSEMGGAHILVNNAGVSLTVPFVEGTLEDFKWVMDVNLWGVVYGCEYFLPQLLAQDEGHLVNLSSLFGFIGVPSQSAYCAAKFAVRGLTESLLLELAHTQVGVTCVHPGAVATGSYRHGLD